MKQDFTFYAWRLSWYSAKVRSYLQYRGIPFTEKQPWIYAFKHSIPKHCAGAEAVPVVVTPEGEWLQDSSVILDRLEERFGAESDLPTTPIQRMFTLLADVWADEFWHPTALHYRFSFPDYFPAWGKEIGTLLRGFPGFIRNLAVRYFQTFMVGATRDVGVTPDTVALIEQWSREQLDALDRQFAATPFLLGSRPSLADFALMGPINGHLAHDPHPKKVLIETRPHLRAWIERMSSKSVGPGEFLPGDTLPDALAPIVGSLFKELVPYLGHCANSISQLGPIAADDPRYPRMGPFVEVPYGSGTLRRITLPYVAWMVQRVQDQYRQFSPQDAAAVRAWMRVNGGESLLDLKFPRVRLVGLHVARELGATG